MVEIILSYQGPGEKGDAHLWMAAGYLHLPP